jgi:hypothetical protein
MKQTKGVMQLESFRRETAFRLLFHTEGQRKIIEKVITMQNLSKSENEIYSRRIKPKINAIIDFYQTALVVRSKV